MSNPVQVHVGSLDLAAVHSVTQKVLVIDEEEKRDYVGWKKFLSHLKFFKPNRFLLYKVSFPLQLLDILRNLAEEDKIIVFVGKKMVADNLSCDLSMDKISCQCIHGNRKQIDREQALEDLQTGSVKILIATDVASRGLDISDIT